MTGGALQRWRLKEIEAHFATWGLDRGGRSYLRFQGERYVWLLACAGRIVEQLRGEHPGQPVRILDVGAAYQTELIRQWPGVVVDTVGFADDRFSTRQGERHFEFDLNDAQYPDRRITMEPHELVVMAEVIEHLYTSPKLVLSCIASWLQPGGYLIVQTPNAVSLRRRIKMLLGRHPYEMIRETRMNPGHFREYTTAELKRAAAAAGFQVVECTVHNYFGHEGLLGRTYNGVSRVLPPFLKDGITICLRKT
ncbi:MAG: class I SAM-dependent methyltransferase [Dehalococcoidia bacterium]|nr:class I SAM-dependent methyltransferase [Dehalococcoidia bacterium]